MLAGCRTAPKGSGLAVGTPEDTPPLVISEYVLSAGDELKISVYGHPNLTQQLVIPPDGLIFFPVVGEIQATGLGVRDLREQLVDGLRRGSDDHIAAADTLAIRVFRHEDLSLNLQVPVSGTIRFPLIGNVDVAGLSPEQVAEQIRARLQAYLVEPTVSVHIVESTRPPPIADPQVSIHVLRSPGQRVLVLGEVHRPGLYPLASTTHALEALGLAGGPTLNARTSRIGVLRSDADGALQTLVMNYAGLTRGGEATNPRLQAGDIVYVPPSLIANVDRAFQRVFSIARGVVEVESAIWLGQNIKEGPRNSSSAPPSITIFGSQ